MKSHFAEILNHIVPSKVLSAIITGSTARGELTAVCDNGRLKLLSDYEFIFVSSEEVDLEYLKRLRRAFRNLEMEICRSNLLFHIDFSYLSLKQLQKSDRTIRTWDVKTNGFVFYGEDVRPCIPEVAVANLNFKDLNRILIWRLWALTLYCPQSLLAKERITPEQEKLYKYVICRNVLDLTTWMLPVSGILLPTFKERVEYMGRHFRRLQLNHFFDSQFPNFLLECLDGKLKFVFQRPLCELHQTALWYFASARKYLASLCGIVGGASNNCMRFEEHSYKCFEDYPVRRKLCDAFLLKDNLKKLSLSKAISWFASWKFGQMFDFLYYIQLALSQYLCGKIREDYLDEASKLLRDLNLTRLDEGLLAERSPATFLKRWLYLRRSFADFLMGYFRSFRYKANYLQEVLDA